MSLSASDRVGLLGGQVVVAGARAGYERVAVDPVTLRPREAASGEDGVETWPWADAVVQAAAGVPCVRFRIFPQLRGGLLYVMTPEDAVAVGEAIAEAGRRATGRESKPDGGGTAGKAMDGAVSGPGLEGPMP